MGPWPQPQIPTTGNSRHELAQHGHTPYSTLTQWVNLGLTQLTNSTAKGRVYSHFAQCSEVVCSRKLSLQAQETEEGKHWLFQQLLSVQCDKETPALALLFTELFQNTIFILKQQCRIKHWCWRGCLLLLYLCWTSFHLFQRGPWTATFKSHKAGTPLYGQQHHIQCVSQVGLHLTMPPVASRSRQKIHLTVISKNLHWVTESGHKSLFCVRRKNWVAVSKLLEVLLSK